MRCLSWWNERSIAERFLQPFAIIFRIFFDETWVLVPESARHHLNAYSTAVNIALECRRGHEWCVVAVFPSQEHDLGVQTGNGMKQVDKLLVAFVEVCSLASLSFVGCECLVACFTYALAHDLVIRPVRLCALFVTVRGRFTAPAVS